MPVLPNLKQRVIPGLTFAAVMAGGILWNEYSYVLLMLTIATLCSLEFFRIVRKLRDINDKMKGFYQYYATFITCLLFLLTYFNTKGILTDGFLLLTPSILLSVFVIELFTGSEKPIQNIGINAMGIIYVGMPLFLVNFISFKQGEYNGLVLMGMMILIWLNDTGAYLFGSLLGKHPLMPRISPKKSIEGFIGGIITAMAVGVAWFYISKTLTLYDWIILGFLAGTMGTVGDLVESMFKRSLDIKDTGNFIPGHGGILDRFDAILIALPIMSTYIIFRLF